MNLRTCVKARIVAGAWLVLSPAFAKAAVPTALQCKTPDDTDCVDQGVLVLEAKPDLLIQDGAFKQCRTISFINEGIHRTSCFFDRDKVAERAVQVLKDKGVDFSTVAWDQIAIFYADSDQPSVFGGTRSRMMFYRAPRAGTSLAIPLGDAALSEGVNEVDGIGQAVNPRNPNFPFIGFVEAGSTTTYGDMTGSLEEASVNLDARYRACDPSSLCNDGFTSRQALAQATSQMFGPYLNPEAGLEDDSWYAQTEAQRSLCVPHDQAIDYAVPPALASGTVCSKEPQLKPTYADPSGAAAVDLTLASGLAIASPERPEPGPATLTVCPDQKWNLANSSQPPSVRFFNQNNGPVCEAGRPKPPRAGAGYGRIRPRIWNSFMDLDSSLMGSGVNWELNGNNTASNVLPATNLYASAPYRGRAMAVFHPLELWLMGLLPIAAADGNDGLAGIPVLQVSPTGIVGPQAGLGRFTRNAGPRMGPVGLGVSSGAERLQVRSDGFVVRGLQELLGRAPVRSPAFAEAPHVFKQLWVVVTKPNEFDVAPGVTCPGDSSCDNDPGKLAAINRLHVALVKRWRKDWQQHWYMLTQYRGKMLSAFDTTVDDAPYWEFMQRTDDKASFTATGGLRFTVSGPRPEKDGPGIDSFMNVSTPGAAGTITATSHANQPPLAIDARATVEAPLNALSLRMRLPTNGQANAFATVHVGDVTVRVPQDPTLFLVPDGQQHTYVVDLMKVPGYSGRVHTQLKVTPSSEPVVCDENDLDAVGCLRIEFIRLQTMTAAELADADKTCASETKPDGWAASVDNCPSVYNPDQYDGNLDGIGDACQDLDSDQTVNACDLCPEQTGPAAGCPANTTTDAGTPADGGAVTEDDNAASGCSCNVGRSGGGGWHALWLTLAALLWRRRRARR